ncbi:putative Zn-dependent protease [Dyadobacter sp. BE34]|uniref:Zn-dependent protease n=1 Tax=Dyadobacter fermentans TaxID=94254 RepID=A0ABU1QT65_9BACT|nr:MULTISPECIES: hypothetical protein [Dyadobacter]MDR6803470.1 putative Zn-dependent protease [Dyadobacter fermentans]MDR7041211.1 putative Zn-dependent protease [Dyadobacter sp. BE242]MDR7195614.1 putative Zn-dependent protease [Dyadobacter sp. BE34]MDR7213841.1 putative Zn-dependent protease [Dyadobacter sp. BE31]MDR7261021.1 putative Zn-dependent protease [Dyadobacter sp. BE32]
MRYLFAVLKSVHGDVKVELLNTHPVTVDRLRTAEEMEKRQGKVREDEALERKWEAIQGVSNK